MSGIERRLTKLEAAGVLTARMPVAEQRIGRRLERADQRADATPINQPATRARLPDTAGTLHD